MSAAGNLIVNKTLFSIEIAPLTRTDKILINLPLSCGL